MTHGTSPVRAAEFLVVGGGPAGCSCAIELAARGHSVLLVSGPARGPAGAGLPELCAGALGSWLEGRGVATGSAVVRRVDTFRSAWGSSTEEGRQVAFWNGAQHLLVDRAALDACLHAAAEDAGVAHVRATVRAGSRARDGWVLSTEDDRGKRLTLTARFVVDSMGRHAHALLQPDAQRQYLDRLVAV